MPRDEAGATRSETVGSLAGSPDLATAVTVGSGRAWRAFGGGAFVVEPSGCDLLTSDYGSGPGHVDLGRAVDGQVTFACTIGARYAQDEALGVLRETHPRATVTPAVLTDWAVRVAPTPALTGADDLTAPAALMSAGPSTGTLLLMLSPESGLLLKSLARDGGSLPGTVEASVSGVSPRVPAVARFDPAALVGALREHADASGALPYAQLVAAFRRTPADLPLELSGPVDAATLDAFAHAMADRIVSRLGCWVPAQNPADAPVVRLAPSGPGTVTWSLAEPVLVRRRVVLPVDLLDATPGHGVRATRPTGDVSAGPALAALATVTGTCTYERDGKVHERRFTLDAGALALPRDRAWTRVEVVAAARDGSAELALGPFETVPLQLDLGSFPTYGPQRVTVRCVFDDGAPSRAVTLLPDRADDTPDHATTLLLTPQDPVRTFRWFSSTPFADGIRHRPFDGGAWSRHRSADGELVLFSSQLGSPELPIRGEVVVRERAALSRTRRTADSGHRTRETERARETAVLPVGERTSTDSVYFRLDPPGEFGDLGYVPHYELDVRTVSGRREYRVSLADTATSSTLTVHLVATTPPLPSTHETQDPRELPHLLDLALEFLIVAGGGATKTLEFTDLTRRGQVVTAVLTLATIAERDDVFGALTDPARQARLVSRCLVDVLDLVPRPGPETITADGSSTGSLSGRSPRLGSLSNRRLVAAPRPEAESAAEQLPQPVIANTGMGWGGGIAQVPVEVVNWQDFSDAFFAAAPDLPPCGLNTNASRTVVDVLDGRSGTRLFSFCAIPAAQSLAYLQFSTNEGEVPAVVALRMRDRRTGVVQTSNAVEIDIPDSSPSTWYEMWVAKRQSVPRTVAPEPFVFSPVLHAYVFGGTSPSGGGGSGLVRRTLPYRGRYHTYLQDATRPWVIYVFPDEFKVARRERAPHTPFATVRVRSSADGRVTSVVFDYLIAPHVDPQRLANAQARLLADPRFGADAVEFQPFRTDEVVLTVDRPTETGSTREQRPDAAVVLQGALKDTLTMPLGDFRLLFDALHTPTASLFLGHVAITVPGEPAEVIPFTARMDDLEGPVFQATATTAADGLLDVTLTNAIESPLDIQTLEVAVTVGGRLGACVVRAGLPRQGLRPGQSTLIRVKPDVPVSAAARVELTFDLAGVVVHPDPAAIWEAILDRTTVDYFRMITVKVLRSVFDPVAGRETEQIQVVVVEFEGGATAELVPTAGTDAFVTATVRVDYPIDDVILHRPTGTGYRYTRTVIRADGRQDRDPQPVTGTGDTLYLAVTR